MNVGYYLLFDRVEIHAANAISSPLTYGFPAISGFLGAVHALSRTIPSDQEIRLDGVLIASHDCDVQSYRAADQKECSFNQTRNPIKKNGKTASIVEEGKVHLTVSLLIEVRTSKQSRRWIAKNETHFIDMLTQRLIQKPIAGGSVRHIHSTVLYERNSLDDAKLALLPAFVLMTAQKELIEITSELQELTPSATALDALVEVSTLHHIPPPDNKTIETKPEESIAESWTVKSAKSGRGWLVPMPVGFQNISKEFKTGELAHCRNPEYPSQYTECVYSLGKWVFPHRINDLSASFWRYYTSSSLFLVSQSNN
jgi:CRISPR-associated protein Csy2